MKKILLTAFVLAAGLLLLGSQFNQTEVSAQDDSPDNSTRRQPNDQALASFIERLTDRSSDDLVKTLLPDGSIMVDLGDGFQNVMLSKVSVYGDLEAACVTSLEEANRFLGRNLETGAPIYAPEYNQNETIEQTATRHGMSEEEYRFYTKLVEDVNNMTASPETATINIVNLDGAGEGFNDPTAVAPEGGNNGTTRGAQRLNLFNFAAGIWGAFLDSNVTINVDSKFDSLSPCTPSGGVLGAASTINIHQNFSSAEFPGTWYHAALANKREGFDLNPAASEMRATFNTEVDNGCLGTGTRFYYGLNNSTPPGRINLLVVLLHEMGHGLGFSSFVNGTTGAFNGGVPDIYARYMYDRTTMKYWYQMTNAERQASAINTGNVLWDGANVRIASPSYVTNGRDAQGRVQLFTPNPVQSGSSISHFDSAVFPNLLMEPAINIGIPIDLDLTRQQMRDIGWYRDTDVDRIPDDITNVQPSGGSVQIGTSVAITWTNVDGFNQPVTIDLSTDGGVTYTPIAQNVTNTGPTGSFNYTVPNLPTTTAKIRVREFEFVEPSGESAANFTISSTPPAATGKLFDFDGDNRADVSVFRPAQPSSAWFIDRSTQGFTGVAFGTATDIIAPADFDGDGKTDVSVFRDGTWFYLQSSDGAFKAAVFGQAGDDPRPADFDGDGKADINVFRPSNGTWYRLNSSNGAFIANVFGQNGDQALVANFDGDNKADIAVFRPSSGTFFWLESSTGLFRATQFGISTDIPTPADFDGDGKTDIAVFRPANGTWYRYNSSNGAFVGEVFGQSGDFPVAADYDGDNKADIAVFRPSLGAWYILRSSNGTFTGQTFGISVDIPVPAAYVQ